MLGVICLGSRQSINWKEGKEVRTLDDILSLTGTDSVNNGWLQLEMFDVISRKKDGY